jgi:hypothetical protein
MTALFQDQDGVLAINRHYAQISAAPTIEELGTVADGYMDWMIENQSPAMESNWSLTGLTVRDMNVEDGLEFTQSTLLPQNGQVGSSRLPNQVSATITWLTGFVGRSFRGRTYVVGLPGQYIATGQKRLTPEGQSGLEGNFNTLLDIMNTAEHPLVVVSFFHDNAPRTEGVSTLIVSARCNFPLATQRRRLR